MKNKRPKNGSFFPDKNNYWEKIEKFRTDKGLPKWSFDFISVHAPILIDGKPYGQYSLVSPMCIIERKINKDRPKFEQNQYRTKVKAIKAAKALARHFGLFVLYCG